MWNNKRVLTKEEVYKDNENLVDKNFIYFEDNTCIEINPNTYSASNYGSNAGHSVQNFTINYYKLINLLPIDLPLYKWAKVLHNEEGAAYIRYTDNKKISEVYYIGGNICRKDKPASITYYDNGNVSGEIIYDNGSIIYSIKYYMNGSKMEEHFYKKGQPSSYGLTNQFYHRTDGPAQITYFDNGKIKTEKHYIDGLAQNPITVDKNNSSLTKISEAHKEYDINGKLIYSTFFTDGRITNSIGAAIINNRTKSTKKYYYYNGIRYSYLRWLLKTL